MSARAGAPIDAPLNMNSLAGGRKKKRPIWRRDSPLGL
jgi:hypothetical protein